MNNKISITLDLEDFVYLKGAYEEYMAQPNHLKPCGFGRFVWNHIFEYVDTDSYWDDRGNYIDEHLDEIIQKYPEVKDDEEFSENYLD